MMDERRRVTPRDVQLMHYDVYTVLRYLLKHATPLFAYIHIHTVVHGLYGYTHYIYSQRIITNAQFKAFLPILWSYTSPHHAYLCIRMDHLQLLWTCFVPFRSSTLENWNFPFFRVSCNFTLFPYVDLKSWGHPFNIFR